MDSFQFFDIKEKILNNVSVQKGISNENQVLLEVSDSSENILPPGCGYSKSTINFTKHCDWCIVGAGFSGTVFAEGASQLEECVLVLDYRPHIGGNCYDFIDQNTGTLRNQYGSHLFHTKIERV